MARAQGLLLAGITAAAVAAGGYWYVNQSSTPDAEAMGDVLSAQSSPAMPEDTQPAAGETPQPAPTAETPKSAGVDLLKATDIEVPLSRAVNGAPVIGKTDAPITVTEYSSFNCPHCAHFHELTLPVVLQDYVAKGKVKIVFQDFPLNKEAMDASALGRCVPPENFLKYATAVFENIDTWMGNHPATIKQYAQMAGVPADKLDSCLTDKNNVDKIMDGMKTATETHKDLNSTPTFYINDKDVIRGAQDSGAFAAKFDELLKAKK